MRPDASPVEPGIPHRGSAFHTGTVLIVSFAHFAHDMFTSLLPALLPLIIGALGISLLQAGSLVVATQLPSLLNPWIGYLTDRWRIQRWLVVIAPGTTGLIICLIGLAPGYGVLVTMLLTAGFSVAALHVSGPVIIRQFAGPLVGRGMGFFMFAGEMARTLSPLIAVQLVALFGLHGIWRLAPVAVASSIVLWWRLPADTRERGAHAPLSLLSTWRRARRLIVAVGGVLVARAFLAAALTTFLPTFIYGEGGSLWVANASLAILELAGAAGALTMGSLSDRLGRRRVLVGCVALAPVAMLGFMVATGAFRVVALVILGFVTISTTPVLIAAMIEHSGTNPATQNGTFMMMNFAIRGLIILVVGAMGDMLGLRGSYAVCAVLAIFGLPFALMIPAERPAGRVDTEVHR